MGQPRWGWTAVSIGTLNRVPFELLRNYYGPVRYCPSTLDLPSILDLTDEANSLPYHFCNEPPMHDGSLVNGSNVRKYYVPLEQHSGLTNKVL